MKLNKLFSLEKKVVLITGGAGYLGKPMSEALAEAGANVIVASRDEEKCKNLANSLEKSYKNRCMGIFLDLKSMEIVDNVVKTVIDEFGKIDVLVNNAAFSDPAQIEEMSMEQWNNGMDGTINSVFRSIRAVINHMKSRKEGNIVNISSMYGMVSPDPSVYGDSKLYNPPNYGVGKAAVLQLTRYCAVHLAPYRIRVNSISPGPFPHKEIQSEKWFIQNLEKKVPLGRIGKPSELKGAIVFLASEASSYMTGHNLVVDGGWTIW